jgi:hypothetical protein
MLLLAGPILRLEPMCWDTPATPKEGEDQTIDEQLAWTPILDFGKIRVLEDQCMSFIIRNMCCIPAPITLVNKLAVFSCNHSEYTIAPFDMLEVQAQTFFHS